MKKYYKKFTTFLGTWTGSIITVLILTSFIAQSFIIPSGSMKDSLLIGDMLIGKKFAYGTPTPRLPMINLPMLPDLFGNGHLIEGDKPKREDIVIFLYPKDNTTHYVKRCVAVGGDELVYVDKKLYIHFHEGDAYIKKHYSPNQMTKFKGKLWVENPYMSKYPGIGYRQERGSIFEHLLQYIAYGKEVDMKPVYIEGLYRHIYEIKGQKINALYTKVASGHYYMIGDNRENSNDSRFWGGVPYKNVIAKPWFVLLSMEHRSYESVLKGDENGNGQDHTELRRVCNDIALDSNECKALWSSQRFHIRWHRLLRSVEWLQKQDFLKEQ